MGTDGTNIEEYLGPMLMSPVQLLLWRNKLILEPHRVELATQLIDGGRRVPRGCSTSRRTVVKMAALAAFPAERRSHLVGEMFAGVATGLACQGTHRWHTISKARTSAKFDGVTQEPNTTKQGRSCRCRQTRLA